MPRSVKGYVCAHREQTGTKVPWPPFLKVWLFVAGLLWDKVLEPAYKSMHHFFRQGCPTKKMSVELTFLACSRRGSIHTLGYISLVILNGKQEFADWYIIWHHLSRRCGVCTRLVCWVGYRTGNTICWRIQARPACLESRGNKAWTTKKKKTKKAECRVSSL
jgi:hypothetical protein